eukprot:COSAG06_NODE_7852_length_2352_cov_296.342654_1_plen_38_part_00
MASCAVNEKTETTHTVNKTRKTHTVNTYIFHHNNALR